MNNVHPIFDDLLNAFSGQPSADKISTNEGDKTVPEIMDHLMWSSYKTNRDLGCSHEGLVRIGVGNDAMKERYELEKQKAIN